MLYHLKNFRISEGYSPQPNGVCGRQQGNSQRQTIRWIAGRPQQLWDYLNDPVLYSI
jgi:hypothetical protein